MEHHNGAGFLSNALHNLFHRGSSVDPRSVPSGSGATPASDRSGRPSDAMDEDLDSAPAHHEPAPLNSVSQHTHQAMDQDAEMAPLVFAPSDDSRAASAASLPETAQPSETALAAIFDTTSHEVVMPVTAVPSDDMPPLIGDDTRSISSMPSLQSVSDSSSDGGFADHDDYMSDSSRDAADVEMVLDDDGDSAWTDNDDMPPLVDTAGLASAPNSAPHRHTVEVEEVQDPDAAAGPSANHTPPPPPAHATHAHPHDHGAHQPNHQIPHPFFANLPPFTGMAGAAHGQGPTLPSLRTLFPFANGFAPPPPADGNANANPANQNAAQTAPQAQPGGQPLPEMVSVTIDMAIPFPWPPRAGNAGQPGQPQPAGQPPVAGGPPAQPNANANGQPRPHGQPGQQYQRVVIDSFSLPPFQLPTRNNATAAAGEPTAANPPQANGDPASAANPPPTFDFTTMPLTDLFGLLSDQIPTDPNSGWVGFLGTIFGALAAREDDREDPNRARRLIAGLEPVSEGMILRMKRLNESSGESDGDGGDGCAICWEALSEEPAHESEDAEMGEAEAAPPHADPQPVAEPVEPAAAAASSDVADASNSNSSTTAAGQSEQPADAPKKEEKPLPRVVSLPCSHVFHSACLVPWFARPRQTTCPACRFNIDPENLTYEPRARARAAPARQQQTGPTQSSQTQGQPAQQEPAQTQPEQTQQTQQQPGPQPQQQPGPRPQLNFANLFNLPPLVPLVPTPAEGAAQPQDGAAPMPQQQPRAPPQQVFTNIFQFPPQAPAPAEAAAQPQDGAVPTPQQPPGTQPTLAEQMFANMFQFPSQASAPAQGAAAQPQDGAAPVPPQDPTAPQASAAPGVPPQNTGALPQLPPIFPFGQGVFTLPPMTLGQDGAWLAWPPGINMNLNLPAANAANANPTANPPPANANPPTAGARAPRREKRPWTPPPPPGPTLRQRVEQRERERGLRCDDVSCGLGPSDEDPMPPTADVPRIGIRPLEGHAPCAHAFHAACLVSAERVAGWGGEADEEEMGERERAREGGTVEVSCPVCRAVGELPREQWSEGVHALAP